MNRLCVCIVFFAFAVIAARAEQTNTPAPASATGNAAPSGITSNALPASITIDSTAYEEVRWGRVTLTTVTIFHKTGVATIPLAKLPPELQKRFGYDPQRVADWQAAKQKAATDRANAENQRAEVMAKSRLIWGDIIQVTPEGPLMQTYSIVATDESPPQSWTTTGPVVLLLGHPRKGQLADGEHLQFYGYQDGTWSYHGADKTEHTVQRWVYVSDKEPK